MRAQPIIFFLVVALIAGYLVYREAADPGRPGIVDIGEQAPDFMAKDENGRDVKLSDYRGKLVFLNFWTTWCVPCVDEMPEMEVMHQAFKGRNFQMLAISHDVNWKLVKDFTRNTISHSLPFSTPAVRLQPSTERAASQKPLSSTPTVTS